MIRRLVLYSMAIGCFGFGLFVMSMIPSGNQNEQEALDSLRKEETLKRIRVLEIQPSSFEETILIPGKVEAYADITLASAIPGIVEKVNVKEGDFVKAGQELFQIDLRSRNAMLQEAEAAFELAQKTLARSEKLFGKGNVTVQELDEAKASEIQARATVKRMEVEVSLGHVFAPQNGYIDSVDVEEGEFIHDGVPLAQLLNLNPVKVSVGVPEKYADAVSKEKEGQVLIESLNEKRNAAISRLAYGANPMTNTFESTLTLSNEDYRLRPGMIVRAQFVTRRKSDALLVPLFALVKTEQGMSLYVEKEGIVEARKVSMGGVDGDRIEIIEGLAPHEKVVVVGQQDIVDQQKVHVMEPVAGLPVSVTSEVIP